MRRSESTVGGEFAWLVAWLIMFVALTWLLLRFLVPHHFNDRIAVMISAIFSSIAWIAVRAYAARRA